MPVIEQVPAQPSSKYTFHDTLFFLNDDINGLNLAQLIVWGMELDMFLHITYVSACLECTLRHGAVSDV